MLKPKKTLTFGTPLKEYVFSGKYQGIFRGLVTALTGKETFFAPIYICKKGGCIIDITQARSEKDI